MIIITLPALCTSAPITGPSNPVIARTIARKFCVIEKVRLIYIVVILNPSYNHIDTSVLQPFLNRWLDVRKKLDSGEWTLEQYEDWQVTFPIAVPAEKSKAAESNADSSGEMIKSGKHKRPRKPKKQ